MPRGKPIGNKERETAVKKKLARPALRGLNPRTMTAVSGYDKHAPDKEDVLLQVGSVFNDLKIYAIDVSDAQNPANVKVYGEPSGFIRIPPGVRVGVGHVKSTRNWWVAAEKLARAGHYFPKQVKLMSKGVDPNIGCGGDMKLIAEDDDD